MNDILHNITLQDAAGTLLAALVFVVILFAPGYLTLLGTNLFGFRRLRFARQALWSILGSFAVAPIMAHLLGRLFGLRSISGVFVLCGAACAALLLAQRSRLHIPKADRRLTLFIAAGWTAAVLVLLLDLQIGHRLFYSVVMADGSYRIAFTEAVLRSGIPPHNMLYFAGAAAHMRYYYFWYVLCAAVAQIAHISARQAFFASSIWAGFGLVALVSVAGSHFYSWRLRQRHLALGLLLVTGADLLPALGQALLQPTLNGDTEWWSVDPLDGWPDSLLWVPHHVAAVLCCLTAFFLLWHTVRPRTRPRDRLVALCLVAIAFASAFGLSVYVAFGFALLMVAWLVRCWLIRDPHRSAWLWQSALAGAGSLFLLLPFLHELFPTTHTTPAQPAPPPFVLSVRQMIDAGLLSGLPLFARWNTTHPRGLDLALRLALLPPGLALELGLYGAVLALLLWGRRGQPIKKHPTRQAALFFSAAGLILTMFLSSSVISNNDFGYRAVMIPQFFLLLLTADVLGGWQLGHPAPALAATPVRRRVLTVLLVLGAAATAYWAVLLRAWLPMEAARPATGYAASPDEAWQVRDAFQTLNRVAPQNAVVAFRAPDPTPNRQGAVMVPNEYFQRMLVMDSNRQLLNAEEKCATQFGGDPGPCHSIQQATAALYASPVPSAKQAQAFCAHFGVRYLVLTIRDPLWHSLGGWPTTLPVMTTEPRIKILQCTP